MKVGGSLKNLRKRQGHQLQLVKRGKRIYVLSKKIKRFKARQGY